MNQTTAAKLDKARHAAARRAWREARELFSSIDDETLAPEDLEAKADALWWTSLVDESIEVRQKAYAGYVAAGNKRRAAFAAWFLSVDFFLKGDLAIGSGWGTRAQRDIADEPECREAGLVTLDVARRAHDQGDSERALTMTEEVLDLARRLSDGNLAALATTTLGKVLIGAGRLDEGCKFLDEAMVSVIAGLLEPLYTGMIFCDVLGTCFSIADLRRAGEWADAAARWYERMPDVSPFHGICRIHQVEVKTLRGAWDRAESDARLAADELSVVRPAFAAAAVYALGEINRRRGNLAAAEEEFARAHAQGREPQPGLALVRLAQGNAEAAAAGLRLPLAEAAPAPIERAALLSAQVEVALANGDREAARVACDELDQIAGRWGTPLLQASAWTACAARFLAEGDAQAAVTSAHRASRLFHDMKLPHEAALARIVLGVASRRAGDEERARLEIGAARAELEALGAKLDARRAADLLAGEAPPPGGLSDREIEVLRLVASGKTNREIAAEMVISEHTVSRHLQNIFRKLGVSTRAAATAFAFENSLVWRPMG